MKLAFAIVLCSIAPAEVGADWWLYIRRKMEDNHALTMLIRWALMVLISAVNPTVQFWQSLLMTFTFHLLFFPILMNVIVLKRPFDYLSPNVWSDQAEQWIRNRISTAGVFFFKIVACALGIYLYINPSIYPKWPF